MGRAAATPVTGHEGSRMLAKLPIETHSFLATLCEARTLVTRSGSALLEGLAAGCDVIFFNPNRERAADYLTSEFPAIREVTADSELAEALACRPDFTTMTVCDTFCATDPGRKVLEVIQDGS